MPKDISRFTCRASAAQIPNRRFAVTHSLTSVVPAFAVKPAACKSTVVIHQSHVQVRYRRDRVCAGRRCTQTPRRYERYIQTTAENGQKIATSVPYYCTAVWQVLVLFSSLLFRFSFYWRSPTRSRRGRTKGSAGAGCPGITPHSTTSPSPSPSPRRRVTSTDTRSRKRRRRKRRPQG